MIRKPNTDINGNKFSTAVKKRVWGKASFIDGHPEDIWRRDEFGNVMNWQEFGNHNCERGWEIDHINPVSNGGTDNIHNLRPVNWKVNVEKGDQYPWPEQS